MIKAIFPISAAEPILDGSHSC